MVMSDRVQNDANLTFEIAVSRLEVQGSSIFDGRKDVGSYQFAGDKQLNVSPTEPSRRWYDLDLTIAIEVLICQGVC